MDGQTKVLNRVHEYGAPPSGTGFSPFVVIYGKPLSSIPHYLQGSPPVEASDTLFPPEPPFMRHYNVASLRLKRLWKWWQTLIAMKFSSRLAIGCISDFALTIKLNSPQLIPSSPNVITVYFRLKNVLAQLLIVSHYRHPHEFIRVPCFLVKTAPGPTCFSASPFTTYKCGPSSRCWTAICVGLEVGQFCLTPNQAGFGPMVRFGSGRYHLGKLWCIAWIL